MSHEHRESLPDTVSHILEECRMVLPGVQALFGFQLIAVFNQVFWDRLTAREQYCHFIATALVVLSIALVMTPAAYHRQAEPETISRNFVMLSSRVLSWSMFPLTTGILIELYIIGHLIFGNAVLGLSCALLLGAVFMLFWWVLPRHAGLQEMIRRRRW